MLRIISVQLASAYSMMLFMVCVRCVCLLWYRKFVVRDVTRWVYQKWSIIYLEQFTIKCFLRYINYIVIYFAKFQSECLLSVHCTMDNGIPIHPMSMHRPRYTHARTHAQMCRMVFVAYFCIFPLHRSRLWACYAFVGYIAVELLKRNNPTAMRECVHSID